MRHSQCHCDVTFTDCSCTRKLAPNLLASMWILISCRLLLTLWSVGICVPEQDLDNQQHSRGVCETDGWQVCIRRYWGYLPKWLPLYGTHTTRLCTHLSMCIRARFTVGKCIYSYSTRIRLNTLFWIAINLYNLIRFLYSHSSDSIISRVTSLWAQSKCLHQTQVP